MIIFAIEITLPEKRFAKKLCSNFLNTSDIKRTAKAYKITVATNGLFNLFRYYFNVS